MNIVMVMSKDRLEQEHAMLNRIVVGLVNDGHQIVRIVPATPHDAISPFEKAVSLAKRITTPMPVSWLLRKTRREDIAQRLEKIDVDAIIAFGKDALQVALDLSKRIDVPILKEVITMQEAKRVRKSSPIWQWFAPTPSIEQTIASRVGEHRTSLVPIATATSHSHHHSDSAKNRCVVVLDASANPKATKQILDAMKSEMDSHLFLELTGKKQHAIWKYIQELDMLDRVTCLRDMAALRPLVVECDLLVLPSPYMPVRTLVLEAMLASIPIVATTIEGFDMLIDEETAIIVNGSWVDAIHRGLYDAPLIKRIGESGRRLVEEQYPSSAQIAAFEAVFTLI
jgi:glycosyltransferase involved in cell wall biosynthesis